MKRKLEIVKNKKAKLLSIFLLFFGLHGFAQSHEGHNHTEGDGHNHEQSVMHTRKAPTEAELECAVENQYCQSRTCG